MGSRRWTESRERACTFCCWPLAQELCHTLAALARIVSVDISTGLGNSFSGVTWHIFFLSLLHYHCRPGKCRCCCSAHWPTCSQMRLWAIKWPLPGILYRNDPQSGTQSLCPCHTAPSCWQRSVPGVLAGTYITRTMPASCNTQGLSPNHL